MQEHVQRLDRFNDVLASSAAESLGSEDYRSLFLHYVQTLRYRAWIIIVCALLATMVTAGLSTVFLFANPRYAATAIISVLPTDSEIRFTRDWLGRSLIDPSTVGTVTHLEQMHSRPVMERALDIVLESYDPMPSTGWRVRVREVIQQVVTAIWKIFSILNTGGFNPPDEHEQRLHMLRSGITVTAMQASYILKIDAFLPDPTLAALAANAVAEAYAEHSRESNAQTARALSAFLAGKIDEKQAELDAATRRLGRLEQATAGPLAGDLGRLGLETARAEAVAARTELDRLRATVAQDGASNGEQALEAEIALLDARLQAAEAGQARLESDREAMLMLERAISELEGDVARLRDRLLMVDLSMTEGVSRVQVVEPARPPSAPASPKVLNYTLASTVAGLLIGGVLVVALDIFDDRIQTPAQLSRATGGRSLGVISRRVLRATRHGKARILARDKALVALARLLMFETDLRHGADGEIHICGLGEANALTDEAAVALSVAAERLGRRLVIALGDQPTPLADDAIRLIAHRSSAAEALRLVRSDSALLLCLAVRGQQQQTELLRFAAEATQRLGHAPFYALVETG